MKTWNDYKEHVKSIDPEAKLDIEDAEAIAAIVGAIIEKTQSHGYKPKKTCCYMRDSNIISCKDGIVQDNS